MKKVTLKLHSTDALPDLSTLRTTNSNCSLTNRCSSTHACCRVPIQSHLEDTVS